MAADITELTATILCRIAWDFAKSQEPGGTQNLTDIRRVAFELGIVEGLDAYEANQVWADRRYVSAASPNDDLDLYGGLENGFGDPIQFATIRAMLISNLSTTAGDKLIVGGATNPFLAIFEGISTSRLTIGPRSPFVIGSLLDGFAVVDGVSDVLRVAYGGSSGYIQYDIVLLGTQLNA